MWFGLQVNFNCKYACKDVKKTLACFLFCCGGKLRVKPFFPCSGVWVFFLPSSCCFQELSHSSAFLVTAPWSYCLLTCSQLFSIALSSLLTQFFQKAAYLLPWGVQWKESLCLSHSYLSFLANASHGSHCNSGLCSCCEEKLSSQAPEFLWKGFICLWHNFWVAKNNWKLSFSSGL